MPAWVAWIVALLLSLGWTPLPAPPTTAQEAPGRPTAHHAAHPAARRLAARPGGLQGVATWYPWHLGYAAAGPGLRAYLGPRWRGTRVVVWYQGRHVVVRLNDWCACPGGRIIDLSRSDFASLAPPSRGVLKVKVTR